MTTPAIDSFRAEYFFLSNFSPYPVYGYPTLEHAFQAAKFAKGSPLRIQTKRCTFPSDAKRFAKRKKAHWSADWHERKIDVMRLLIRRKFDETPDLVRLLLATGTAILIEGNTWGDVFWGVCEGIGENWLGRILMEERNYRRSLS
jgi:ribA/ribD-fused uncharacterized protein